MAGIAAIVRTDGGPVGTNLIEAMTAAMAHRGPDGIAHRVAGGVALGHCQFCTTREALEEDQPVTSADGQLLLVMDGYLANWEALRTDLLGRGAVLRDRSDPELVLHAYETWGPDFVRHLEGEFAFILWDGRTKELFAARDHQGLRPLVYAWDGTTLVAASDVAAVLAALPAGPEPDHEWLAEWATGELLSRVATPWRGVIRLLPASSLHLGNGGPHVASYWSVPLGVTIRYRREEDYVEHYRAVLADCVRAASRSHLPAAYAVSGGLDSSAVFAVALDLLRQGRLPAPDARAYVVAGPAGTAADEMVHARAVARHLGVPLAEVAFRLPGLAWFTEMLGKYRDIIAIPNSAHIIGMERQVATDGCRICVGGQGGDQWLQGAYEYYREDLLAGDWCGLRRSFRADRRAMGLPMALRCVAQTTVRPYLPPRLKSALRRAAGMPRRWKPDFPWLSAAALEGWRERHRTWIDGQRRLGPSGYKQGKLVSPWTLVAMDITARQGVLSGIEHRNPMLLRQFIEFCSSTPESMRLRGGQTKYIHRKAVDGLLPASVAWRRDKAEFSHALTALRGEMAAALGEIVSDPATALLDRTGLEQLHRRYCTAAIDELPHWPVWGVLTYVQLLRFALAQTRER